MAETNFTSLPTEFRIMIWRHLVEDHSTATIAELAQHKSLIVNCAITTRGIILLALNECRGLLAWLLNLLHTDRESRGILLDVLNERYRRGNGGNGKLHKIFANGLLGWSVPHGRLFVRDFGLRRGRGRLRAWW